MAAENAVPVSVQRDTAQEVAPVPSSYSGRSFSSTGPSSVGAGAKVHAPHKHRRLSSSGHARRRLSDAREAASRPSPVTISTAAAALTSLAKLSLSGTPPPQALTTYVSAAGEIEPASAALKDATREEADLGGGISVAAGKGTGKKKGTIFKCESCSKVYRHPSCLIKHRWEHSPHWREASKFLLSKHQQVQLLEAAAILSHIAPSAAGGTSLPDDRALWPSYLSGGIVPPPSAENTAGMGAPTKPCPAAFSLEQPAPFAVSSSVPALSALSTARSGPRMHDYAVSVAGGVTQLRPGVLAVPTGSESPQPPPQPTNSQAYTTERSAAVPITVPSQSAYRDRDPLGYSFVSRASASASDAWSSPVSLSTGFAQSSFRSSSASASALGQSYEYPDGTGGWSLPRSSVRSGSRSRSGSASESDYVDVESMDGDYVYGFSARSIKRESSVRAMSVGEKIEEEWDGMEMEMEL
ncbi:uncharacterized protein B0H18DRAFT_1085689 [Fomitopsis serialis]|uniref:uncharacterized protein n=1 Tax=Fomitopsis serialis TaxID=139415 RepID=UPI002008719D|nr:uncharacterized protein B0H18DRAFT_1085689 [Neoantrodia serialis]KAH9923508.1 hypothetical protein B0H18DRAFT_1085689 [Neoantrodia serialis]